jgi:hypothetical protein
MCNSAMSALCGVGPELCAVLVTGAGDAAETVVAGMTAFGPSLWSSPRRGGGAALGIVAETVGVGKPSPKPRVLRLYATDPGFASAVRRDFAAKGVEIHDALGARSTPLEDEAALALFRARRPAAVVTRTLDGVERSQAWAVARLVDDGDAVRHGDRFSLVAEPSKSGTVLRWRGRDSTDGGVHVVLLREIDGREARLVRSAWAEVVTFTISRVPLADGGQARVRLLVLDVPLALMSAFPDGKLPRHGLVEPALEDSL